MPSLQISNRIDLLHNVCCLDLNLMTLIIQYHSRLLSCGAHSHVKKSILASRWINLSLYLSLSHFLLLILLWDSFLKSNLPCHFFIFLCQLFLVLKHFNLFHDFSLFTESKFIRPHTLSTLKTSHNLIELLLTQTFLFYWRYQVLHCYFTWSLWYDLFWFCKSWFFLIIESHVII